MSYDAQERLIAPARRRPELWRLPLGLALAALVMFGLGRAIFAVAHLLLDEDGYWRFVAEVGSATTPTGALVLLFSMGTLGIGAAMAARLLHDRGLLSLIGPPRLALKQFLRVGAAVAALYLLIALLPPWNIGGPPERGLAPAVWIALLPLTLGAILVQTASEELLFRGYLQSQLAARLRHPLAWIGLPTALFALGHYAPGLYGGNAGLVAVWALVFGLAAADLTARSGTLGPAIALHFVNNVTAIALVSLKGELSGLALFHLPVRPGDEAALRQLLPVDLASMAVGWLAARLSLRV